MIIIVALLDLSTNFMSVCLLFLLVLLVDYDYYCGTPWTFLLTLCLCVCCSFWHCWWTLIIIVALPGPFY